MYKLLDDLTNKQSLTYKRLHSVWGTMKQRCCNPNNKDYHKYGGKGITIADEWSNDFLEYAKWCIYNGYKPSNGKLTSDTCSVDRIDPTRGYEPSNCRIISHGENSRRIESFVIPIYVYSGSTGEFIQEYDSLTECVKDLSLSIAHVSSCVNGERKTHKGYVFRHRKVTRIKVPKNTKIHRPILVTNKETDEVERFESIKEVTEKYGIPSSNISKVLKGKRKSTNGFTFSYIV